MVSTNELRPGMHFIFDGSLMEVLEYQHVKPGKGPAFVRLKMRNLRSGASFEKTFNTNEKVEYVRLETKYMEYLYRDGDGFIFMDQESYEQTTIPKERMGDKALLLKENLVIGVQVHDGEIIGIDLPQFMEFEIAYTEPGEKGNTVSGTTKKAELSSGAIVLVPLFINQGDVIKIDTRDMRYIERANK